MVIYNHNLTLDLALDFALADTLGCVRVLGAEPSRDHTHAYSLARDLGLNEFAKELNALSTPIIEDTDAKWNEFADKLRALMIKHRDIGHEWNLTETQERRLTDYLNATGLLRDCLELAFMPPDEKKAMLNSLYLPPAQAEDGQKPDRQGGRL